MIIISRILHHGRLTLLRSPDAVFLQIQYTPAGEGLPLKSNPKVYHLSTPTTVASSMHHAGAHHYYPPVWYIWKAPDSPIIATRPFSIP